MILMTPDLRRILDLPERDPPAPEPLDLPPLPPGQACACAAMGRRCLTRLFGAQRAALEELAANLGLFGMLAVGSGKTMLSILAPVVLELTPAVLLLPPGQIEQTIEEAVWIGQHARVPRLYHVRSGAEEPHPVGGAPGTDDGVILYLLPYSVLSRPEASDLLERLDPRFVEADEIHRLKHRTSAGTKRVMRCLADDASRVFAGWSGTPMGRSINESFHLMAFTLREGSPLPLDVAVAASWAECFDSGQPAEQLVGAFAEYLQPGEDPREGLCRRMFRTKGVIASVESAAELLPPLRFRIEHLEVSREVRRALEQLERTWTTPLGEELCMAAEVWQCRTELLCGFHYRWVWPPGTTVPLVEAWLEARSAWHKELRGRLAQRSRPGLDSPALIASAMEVGKIPSSEAYERWRQARATLPEPRVEPVWIDDSWIAGVVAEARRERALVWFTHDAVGRKLADHLPVFWEAEGMVPALRRAPTAAALSIRACGTGVDGLQRLYDRQIVCCPYASGEGWEQLLGRLHRVGQEREVETVVYDRDLEFLQTAIERAFFVRKTLGLQRKLLIASGLEGIRLEVAA